MARGSVIARATVRKYRRAGPDERAAGGASDDAQGLKYGVPRCRRRRCEVAACGTRGGNGCAGVASALCLAVGISPYQRHEIWPAAIGQIGGVTIISAMVRGTFLYMRYQ